RRRGNWITENALEVGEAVVAAESGVVAKEQQHRRVRQRLRDNRQIDALDPRAEREVAEYEGEHPGDEHDEQCGVPEVIGEPPVPRIGLPIEKNHEVRQVAVIDAFVTDRAHQVHAHCIAAEREEQSMAKRQDAGVAPDEIHRERDDRIAHDLAAKRDRVIGDVQRAGRGHQQIADGKHDEQNERRGGEEHPCRYAEASAQHRRAARERHERDGQSHHASTARPLNANNPWGRFWMNTMMNTSTAILASTAPDHASRNLSTMPRPSAADTVPASCPTPPSTTTMNESTM